MIESITNKDGSNFGLVKKYPRGYWKIQENGRKFLESLANKWNITQPKDWGRVTVQ